jgi:uncharacterized protein YjbI with pentapeptide repeats
MRVANHRASQRKEQKPRPDFDSSIARIIELSNTASASWFRLLGYLAYVTVSLLGVVDADFFIPSRQIQLPIVNVAIPTQRFFWFAPLIGAALYVYLHFQLSKLWTVLGKARQDFGSEAIRVRALPGLINDLAFSFGTQNAAKRRPLDGLASIFSMLLVWAAGPFLILAFWLRSMPAHAEWLTLWIGTGALLSLYVGSITWAGFRKQLGEQATETRLWYRRGRRLLGVAAGAAVVIIGWAGAEGRLANFGISKIAFMPFSSANLGELELVPRPATWRARDAAETAFRIEWCKREGLAPDVCGTGRTNDLKEHPFLTNDRKKWCAEHPPLIAQECDKWFSEADDRFHDEWKSERHAYLVGLPQPIDISDRDLRGANLQRAFLPRAFLRRTLLDGARLWETVMEDAELQGASFVGAYLWGVSLGSANLYETNFDFAILRELRIARSQMDGASLENIILDDVQMDGSNLRRSEHREARLSGWFKNWSARSVDFMGAKIGPSIFVSVDLTGAKNLTQAQLDNVVGDDSTILPLARTGEQLFIRSCWESPPLGFEEMMTRLSEAYHTDFRQQWICKEGKRSEMVGPAAK